MLLAGLGHPLEPAAASGIFFVAQLGKYLPGSVWPYVAQARMGRAHDVPASRSAAAGGLFVLLHCATGALVAAIAFRWPVTRRSSSGSAGCPGWCRCSCLPCTLG